ncbi:MAG: lysophospholipase L1-like esterase [Planctomycetota bacterium]
MSKASSILIKSFKKLLIFLVSLIVLLVVGEVAARMAEPGPMALMDENPYVKPYKGLPQFHKPNFEGRWDGTWYGTNSIGLRGPEISPEKGANEFRVVALGDSCTFGKSVEEAETWPRQLETMLNAEFTDGRNAVVANCGVNGFSGKNYLKMFQVIGQRLNPDLVIVGYNLNDFPNVQKKIDEKMHSATKTRSAVTKIVGGQKNLDRFNESALYRWLRAFYRDMTREESWKGAENLAKNEKTDAVLKKAKQQASSPRHMEALEKELVGLKTAAEAAGARIAFFLFPYESLVYLDEYDTTPIDRLRGICEKIDAPFVDLAEKFRETARESEPKREMFIYGDRYHPRPIGYRVVAENVIDVLRKRGWLTQD